MQKYTPYLPYLSTGIPSPSTAIAGVGTSPFTKRCGEKNRFDKKRLVYICAVNLWKRNLFPWRTVGFSSWIWLKRQGLIRQTSCIYLREERDECTIYFYISDPPAQVISSNNDKIPYSPADLASDADSRGCDWYGPWLPVDRLTWNRLVNTIKCRGKEWLAWKEHMKGCTVPYFPEDFASLPKPRVCGA